MSVYNTVSTETWRIQLPSDWAERECSSRDSIYFESEDGTKGAYFSTWRFDDDPRSAQEILESFRRVEIGSFAEMEGTWETVDERTSENGSGTMIRADSLARDRDYRIVCCLAAGLPWIVRSSFHDYNCTDYEASKNFFQPIIDSLEIHHAEA